MDAKFYIIDPIGGTELPYSELDSNCYVIITTNEGSSHCWFDRLIPKLISYGIPYDQIVIRSACLWDPDSSVKHVHTIVDECTNFVTDLKHHQLNVDAPTHHYVCLNNLHRWQRYQLVQHLLDRKLDQFGKISYLNPPSTADTRFPMIIDHAQVSWPEQRVMSHSAIRGALFNLITETAYEPEPNAEQLTWHHRPGMTEKTYKCFALYQIPVWLAPYRSVECYRRLGFDVFDDIVDHAYDLEIDPANRIELVANQVAKLVELENLGELKQRLIPRFEHNLDRLKYYANNLDSEIPQWSTIFTG